MRRLLIPVLAAGHTVIHVASFGIDDLFILIAVGVYLCLNSK